MNLRYILRVATNLALSIFALFALGAGLWTVDEFLNWNILPDWIDQYAQAFIVLVGMAAGLAIATSLLCSVVLVAEANARRAGIEEVAASPRLRRYVGWSMAGMVVALAVFYRIDLYRKGVAERAERERYRVEEQAEIEKERRVYQGVLRDVRQALDKSLALFPGDLAAGLATRPWNTNQLVTFLGALRSSAAHHPDVLLLLRAEDPYRYVSLQLRQRSESAGPRFELIEQYYTGLPTDLERQTVDEWLAGEGTGLSDRLDGVVLSNLAPAAWGPILREGQVAALLVFKKDVPNVFRFYHAGPGGPDTVSGGEPRRS